jgi:predicted O-linked N-acetylglucosamine transferase (SPINDLY family)
MRLQHDHERAAICCRRALIARPGDATALNYLTRDLHKLGLQNEARLTNAQCLRFHPNDALAWQLRVMLLLPAVPETVDRTALAVVDFDRGLADLRIHMTKPETRHTAASGIGGAQPFYLGYRYGNHRNRLSQYGAFAAQIMAEHWQARTPGILRRRNPISLAVATWHVRRHSVWDVLLHGLLAHLDHDRFRVSLLHLGPIRDEETVRAETLVHRFHGDALGFRRALTLLRDERPDVLFFPDIGLEMTTYQLASLRLAPVQATGLGHPITSGLPTIDLYFSGELLEAEDSQTHYTERLVKLPGTGVCTLGLPAELQAWRELNETKPPHRVEFALCQNPFKFDPADDDLYPRIAKRAGSCRFWLVCDPGKPHLTTRLADRLAQAFQRHALRPEQYLHQIAWMPRGEFLGFLEAMDVYLDCPAFSGYTTAWQALHMGVPIVTLEGAHLRQRLAAGLLRQAGLAGNIATSAEEYVNNAVRLAAESRDAGQRQARRQSIKANATRADGNVAAVRGFEQTLIDELSRRTGNIC